MSPLRRASRLCAASLPFLLALAFAKGALAPAQFRAEMEKAIVAAHPTVKVSVRGELELQLIASDGQEMTSFLDNAYQEYLQSPENLAEIVARHASSLPGEVDLAQADRAQIVPIVKDRAWMEETMAAVKARGGKEPEPYVSEELNGLLSIVYAIDRPKNIQYLTVQNLVELGLERSELRTLAVTNLRRLLPEIELHKGPQVSMVTAGGNYEACLLLLDDLWTNGSIPFEGEAVVAIPTRDLLLVTGTKTPGGIARLREIASKSVVDTAYRLTDALFVYRDGKFLELVES